MKPTIVTLDLEGVFTPEIWIEFAHKTDIPALQRTTRDEPNYDKLMHYRIDILRQHNLRLTDIQAVIASMSVLPGARDFLDWLRSRTQVIILSDTFYEFAMPLMVQLGRPTLLCHTLEIDAQGMISGYRLRLPDSKRAAVLALQQLNLHVIAVGDSYNDTSMLAAADHGIFFRPPANVISNFPQFPVVRRYADLQNQIEALLPRTA
ncbi:MAG: bifunctional phosphoserine phosphatase/homoserine phosphotransferase ThrH [Chloroflexi bacterium]|nr:bifunctional phosphoserine phosphatase/homoserine phosphotransferase ThrH [Chloroflexota bacterium]